jgi:nicotinamide-nucleotide adenylyltransferase
VRAHPSRVLFIGRFQPFHKGHEKILAYLLRRYRRITIAIGSSQEKRTGENPFSAKERMAMMARVVRAHHGWKKRISFAFLADYPSNADWARAVRERFAPKAFAIASANPLVRRLLRKAAYTLDPSPLFRRAEWEGRKIRTRIRRGKNASLSVPLALKGWMERKGKKIMLKTRF